MTSNNIFREAKQMSKTVTLKLSSPLCDEEIEVPEELWERLEARAKELETPVEELFTIALMIS